MIKTVRQLGQQPIEETPSYLEALLNSDLELEGLMPWSSNYTFLVKLTHPTLTEELQAIYKPHAGARPLWDFPSKTLHKREFLSYLLSQLLGWPKIPATVLREGPHGEGSVQRFVEADYEAHYFTMQGNLAEVALEFQQVALFDLIANNADRKAGHCLQGHDGQIWAIDHGLTFHTEYKLRTVIHEVCDACIPDDLLRDLSHLHELLLNSTEFTTILGQFITARELKAFEQRVEVLLQSKHFPHLSPYNMPYPPI
jgi:uncharacterized repeat protein (TIGR03843 family)